MVVICEMDHHGFQGSMCRFWGHYHMSSRCAVDRGGNAMWIIFVKVLAC